MLAAVFGRSGGTVIGLFPQSSYEESVLDLQPGDVLIAFGSSEPQRGRVRDERLKNLLRQSSHLPVGEMASMIASALKTWIGDAPQYDDLTFILVKVM
jgi:phosphoserine phosphatase RsbU/P